MAIFIYIYAFVSSFINCNSTQIKFYFIVLKLSTSSLHQKCILLLYSGLKKYQYSLVTLGQYFIMFQIFWKRCNHAIFFYISICLWLLHFFLRTENIARITPTENILNFLWDPDVFFFPHDTHWGIFLVVRCWVGCSSHSFLFALSFLISSAVCYSAHTSGKSCAAHFMSHRTRRGRKGKAEISLKKIFKLLCHEHSNIFKNENEHKKSSL